MYSNHAKQEVNDGCKSRPASFKHLLVCSLFPLTLLTTTFVYYNIKSPDLLRSWKQCQQQLTNRVFQSRHYCYDDVTNTSTTMLAHLDNDVGESSVFFIETRCHQSVEDVLTERQACAVESAALTNPDVSVYVLFASETPFDASEAKMYVKRLLEYPNVKLRHIRLRDYMKGTPLERWYDEGALKTSDFPLVHISDVLRLVTLWKFGGIYLDLDTITMRSLKNLVPFAAIANNVYIGNAAIGSTRSGIGHNVLDMSLKILRDNFQGNVWGANGPELITDVLRIICDMTPEESIHSMSKERCQNFNIYPAKYFHPLPYYAWKRYFSTGATAEETLMAVNGSYTVHLWNKMSQDEPAVVESDQPYVRLARKFCPLVFSSLGETF